MLSKPNFGGSIGKGNDIGKVGPPATYLNPALSPDSTRLVVARRLDIGPWSVDLWTFDLIRGVPAKFTSDAGNEWLPVWSPQGDYVAYSMDHGTLKHDLYRRRSDAAGVEELVFTSPASKVLTDWTRTAKGEEFLLFDEDTDTGADISYVPLAGEGKAQSYLRTRFFEQNPHASPDGQWLAYQSDESGEFEIHVRPFPDAERTKVTVSSGGGIDPRWSRDGNELFYFSNDRLMVATVRHDAARFTVLKTEALFPVRRTANRTSYSVAADGQRFLINTIPEGAEANITVVLDWTAGLPAR